MVGNMVKELKKNTKGAAKGAKAASKAKKTAVVKQIDGAKEAKAGRRKAGKGAAVATAAAVAAKKNAGVKPEAKKAAEMKKAGEAEQTKKAGKLKKAGKAKKAGKRKWLIVLAALVLLIAGGVTAAVCLSGEKPTEEVSQEEEPEQTEPEEEEPEEETPAEGNEELVPEKEISNWNTYTVAEHKPRYLSIAAIGLKNVPIIEIGIEGTNTMGAPMSRDVVGWYYRSAYPGRVGSWATVIDGHGGSLGKGVFKRLPELKKGSEIVIEMGSGKKYTYVVTEMVWKEKGAQADAYMKIADRPVDANTPTLTLITCTGSWIKAEQTYSQRLFVRAVLRQ